MFSPRFLLRSLTLSLLLLAPLPRVLPLTGVTAALAAEAPLRVVILPFRNLTRQPADDWLGDSFAESLTMGLLPVEALQLVERGQIGTVLKEQQFGQSAYVDEASAPKLGRLLGASVVVLGSYQKVGEQLQANVRFVDVETGQIDARRAAQVQGRFEQIFDLQKQLATDLVTQLKVAAKPAELAQLDSVLKATDSTEAYRLYMEGLSYLRKGDSLQLDKARASFRQALSIDADYALALAGLAEVHARKAREVDLLKVLPPDMQMGVRGPDDAAQARRYAEQALALAPDLPQGLRALAWVEKLGGDEARAMELIQRAIRLNPRDSDSLTAYISLRFESGTVNFDPEQLRKEFKALGADLDDPWLQFTLGALATGLEAVKAKPHLDGPRALLEAAAGKLPDNPYIPMTLASIALREGKPDLAESYFSRAQQLGSDSPELLAALGDIRLGQGRPQDALALVTRAQVLNPNSLYVRLTMASTLIALKRNGEAEAIYAELLGKDPGNAFIHFSQGISYFAHLQDFARARVSLSKALEIWEARPMGLPRTMLVYFLAVSEMATDDYAAAGAHFEQLLKDPIYYGQAYEMLAQVRSLEKNYAGALEAYTAYLTIHPEVSESEQVKQTYRWYYLLENAEREPQNVAVLNDLGTLAQQRRAPSLAETYWKQALTIEPGNAVVLANYGALCLQLQRAPEALRLLEQAVSLKPDYVKAWYNLGLARQQSGDGAGAKAAWQKVLSLDPAHEGARKALAS